MEFHVVFPFFCRLATLEDACRFLMGGHPAQGKRSLRSVGVGWDA